MEKKYTGGNLGWYDKLSFEMVKKGLLAHRDEAEKLRKEGSEDPSSSEKKP
jgi:hypothetical protein